MHGWYTFLAMFLVFTSANVSLHAAPALNADLRKVIRQKLEGKLLLLNAPSNSDLIQFDVEGRLTRPSKGEPWTTSGLLKAEKVDAYDYQISIDGQRVTTEVDPLPPGTKLVATPTDRAVHVSIEVPRRIQNAADLDGFLSKIFFTADLAEKLSNAWHADVDFTQELADASIIPSDGHIGRLEDGRVVYSWESGAVSKPKAVYKPGPVYPVNARLKHVSGAVRVRVIVNENGFPEILQVIQHLGEGLDANALSAVSQWRFERPMRNGVAAATVLVVELKFNLRGKK